MKKYADLQKLIHELAEVKREYSRLAFDEEDRMMLGEPASPSQIAKLERRLGKPLPPSYRAFLELHNGWELFDGGLNLLSVEDQDSEWVQEWLKMLAMAFKAVDEENPFETRAIPVMLGYSVWVRLPSALHLMVFWTFILPMSFCSTKLEPLLEMTLVVFCYS